MAKRKKPATKTGGGFIKVTLTRDLDMFGVIKKAGTVLEVHPEKARELAADGYLDAPQDEKNK